MSMRMNSWKATGPSRDKWRQLSLRRIRAIGNSQNHDTDTALFITMAQELKDEGNRLFLTRDYEGALIKYDKAIQLLSKNHEDIPNLRTNMAECYMQMGFGEYTNAIHECNLALEVEPAYGKAFLKRARCYEALNRLDLALEDIQTVLKLEPNNLMATEIEQRLRKTFGRQASRFSQKSLDFVPLPKYDDMRGSLQPKVSKEMPMKVKSMNLEKNTGKYSEVSSNGIETRSRLEKRKTDVGIWMRMSEDVVQEKNAEEKVVVEEKTASVKDCEPKRTMKLVFGEDIRWAQAPLNCTILKLREIISDRFSNSKTVLIKYKDQEGDLVTIATTEELRLAEAEASANNSSIKLYVFEVSQGQDPLIRKAKKEKLNKKNISPNKNAGKLKEDSCKESTCITDWIIHFAQTFKNYVGFDLDSYIDIHEVGIKLYSEAMEETVTSEEAQDILGIASDKFLEMAALALFNSGNVHMSRARRRVYFTDECSRDSVLERVKHAYDWAQKEFATAGERYEKALNIKPDFYEAVFALGQQQFERAKLSWIYAIGTGVNLETWPSGDVLVLYNSAEENMERGVHMWEDQQQQQQRLREMYKKNRTESLLEKMKLDNLLKNVSADEAEEQATNFRSQICVLWGTILYDRSMMEFKQEIPVWHECLEAAIEKFELAGASATDIAVMIKNHCSNDTSLEGLGFNIDETVQAWNEMYEAKKWQRNVSSFRLEPLLRRRVSTLYYALERV